MKNLREEISGADAVYGVNVKYSRVAKKYEELPARDLASCFAQLDVFGANRKRKYILREVIEKLRRDESIKKQKLLNRKRYTYISIDKMLANPAVSIQGIEEIKKLIYESRTRHFIERIVKQMNIKNIVAETDTLRTLFSGRGWQNIENPFNTLNQKR
ncbi:hypothetical protein [Desulfurococcus amylolyticus]|uniref:hypothetical protein n=1 Tax=Desulfurococcus amylolyticus TaxID=94694 RepID=UPI0023F03904|nr:hypothetical protein [Desulfurococcus amylolyticus]